ncbi:MAG: hypothetical protein WCX88_04165 [Patescibacteria group bacterium]
MYLKAVPAKNSQKSEIEDVMPSDEIKKFIGRYFEYQKNIQDKVNEKTIHVDEVSSQVASFYENIRRVVDWKDEHAMRQMAIERVLKRHLFLNKKSENNYFSGESIVTELIRGGHFPNDKISRDKIREIKHLVEKYSFIIKNVPAPIKKITVSQFYDFIFKTAACETEEIIDSSNYQRSNILIEFMEETIGKSIYVGPRAKDKTKITSKQKEVQIFIGVQQALFKFDRPIIIYNLLKRYYPEWFIYEENSVHKITKNVYYIFDDIEKCFNHPLADKFYAICESHDTPFLLLGDVIENDSHKFNISLTSPKEIKKMILGAYQTRLGTLKNRVRRSAFYSTVSVFLSKIVLIYLIEIPLAKVVTGGFDFLSSIVDILIPTLLMVTLVATIKLPPSNNFELILKDIYRIIYKGQSKGEYEVELYPSKSFILKTIFGLIYIVSFLVCLSGIILLLTWLNFPPISYVIFIIFTSVIMFTGSVIRNRSRELHVTQEKEGFLGIIIDPFILPIVYFGRWLSTKWQKYNVVAIFLVILVDSPFFMFVDFLEQWRYFMKEKKESIH